MTPEELAAMLDEPAPAAAPEQPAATPVAAVETSPGVPVAPAAPPAPAEGQPGLTPPADDAARYDAQGRVGAAIVTGAAKSIYETKDFIFGKPEEADKSETRRSVEKLDKSLSEESMGYGFVSGLSQFATGLLGAGKLVQAASVVPKVGAAVGALEATKTGAAVLSSGKAAAVGAVAFDPSGPRLSNLVQGTFLANPVTDYLQSKPGDSPAFGRMANALESIGVDAAMAGVFALSVKGFKALQSGDAAAIQASQTELQAAIAHKDAKLAVAKGLPEQVEELRANFPDQVAAAEEAVKARVPAEEPRVEMVPADAEVTLPEIEKTVEIRPDAYARSPEDKSVIPLGVAEDHPVNRNGLNFEDLPDRIQVRGSYLAEAARGQGKGTAMYEELARYAQEQGKPIYSDYDLSTDAMKVYERLKAKGYDVEIAPGVSLDVDGNKAGYAGKFVPGEEDTFTVRINPKPKPEITAPDGPVVTQVDSPTQGAGPAGLPPKPKLIGISDEQLTKLITDGQADTAQLLGPGGWQGAIDRGYVFGDGGSMPWQKFARGDIPGAEGLDPLDFMIARVADELAAPLNKLKGGVDGVLSDAQTERMLAQRTALWNEDPQALMGLLAQNTANARTMSVNMEAASLVAQRVLQDALNLRSRIGLGMLEEFGGDLKAARAALEDHLSVGATALGYSNAMRASAGRTLRRNRLEFQLSLEDVAAMKGLDDAKFFTLLDAVGHDLAVAQKLVKPGFWSRIKDDASYLYINNLLWGLRTHFVNVTTNTYMLMARPAERALGFSLKGDTQAAALQFKQYGYMAASIQDSFRDAVRTWKTGDSIMSPHTAEISPTGVADGGGTNWVAEGYKSWDSVPNILANAYTGFMKGAGLPTRALGTVDELMKQTVYRSKVQTDAFGEGIAAGLEGQALSDHVRKALLDAFDDAGRAVDLKALDEANIATFQQDLLPGTFGKSIQGMVGNHSALRFVLPFVKTPTNVLRMGWKLTPGLNLLQQEYKQMIQGVMGPEKQAQAIGQMAMGSLFMGSAAILAHQGRITGGGPSDPQLMAQLKATGWQPYSFVIGNADGSKTYVNYGRYDPIALPFGMIADIIDVVERDQDGDGHAERAWNAAGGVLLGLVKQMGQKSYLTSLHDVLDGLMDPDKNLAKVGQGMVANFVPASSGLRFVNPDPNLREVRGVLDKIQAGVPGLSASLPAKRDIFGDPLTVHKGLWVDGEATAVDAEVRRMVDESGVGLFNVPSPSINGTDLRDVVMKDGRNAYDRYQELAGHPTKGPSLKETVAKIMKTSAYQNAPDGEAGVKGTKSAMVAGTVSKYRESALRQIKADPLVREALAKRDAEVRAAYAKSKAPPTRSEDQAQSLNTLGKAFGVPLNVVPQ